MKKPIILSGHARDQLVFRGATEEEIAIAIRSESWNSAEQGRLECRRDFASDSVWNKRYYRKKQVRPIFVEEADAIVVVTVYVYFF